MRNLGENDYNTLLSFHFNQVSLTSSSFSFRTIEKTILCYNIICFPIFQPFNYYVFGRLDCHFCVVVSFFVFNKYDR